MHKNFKLGLKFKKKLGFRNKMLNCKLVIKNRRQKGRKNLITKN